MNPSTLVSTPTFTGVIDQRYFLEPLGGAAHPYTYLDRFPETVYNLSPFSHLVKFLYVFLGPAGVGGLRQQYLQLRLLLQERGIGQFNLDDFYGNPFAFGRLLEETYNADPEGFLTQNEWDQIQQSDASYRNRAIEFMNAARAGTSPLGIYLAAKSGLGHDVEVIENYKYLYDQHSDSPIGIPYFGSTLSTEEVIILPRQDISQSQTQNIGIVNTPSSGFFTLSVNGYDTPELEPTATSIEIQNAIEALPNIGPGNVIVLGGPGPDVPWQIVFTGALSGQNISVQFNNSLISGGSLPVATVNTTQGDIETTDENVAISPQDQQQMFSALSQIKPVTSIISYNQASGVRSRTLWKSIMASSEWIETIRFITGTTDTSVDWIQSNVEKEGHKLATGRIHHYQGFHKIQNAVSYTDAGVLDPDYETRRFLINLPSEPYRSEHYGLFNPTENRLFPFLNKPKYRNYKFAATNAPDPNPRLLTYDDVSKGGQATIEEWYPANIYAKLYNGTISHNNFWASHERTDGKDYLELDLGSVQAVNYLSFEVTLKPLQIDIAYDVLDDPTGRRRFFPVTPEPYKPYENNVTFVSHRTQPWEFTEFYFGNRLGTMLYTRYIRIGFNRTNISSPYVDASNGNLLPYAVNVRNLRIGRSVFIDDSAKIVFEIDKPGKPAQYIGITP